jgi:hypothetical protein
MKAFWLSIRMVIFPYELTLSAELEKGAALLIMETVEWRLTRHRSDGSSGIGYPVGTFFARAYFCRRRFPIDIHRGSWRPVRV